jgi:cytochrome c5
LKRDQKFYDMYSLVIGVLAFVALLILVLAMKMTDLTQGVFTSDTEEYQAEVAKRLAPFGDVYMPGDELQADKPQVPAAEAAAPVTTTMTGPQVYNAACIACHGPGIAGAPKVGDAAAWQARIAQGTATLYEHAINGFTGSTGFMPPKGARMDLSDQEVHDAVDYMVSQSE